ncbi:MAG: hypothetical protein JRI23_07690 [Deltaproteobacteria bacterium]|nr:hypothetical protein [Deltaproteobacteria bacterium]MBW2531487.1 hypothetical protein [Deltaproteobacteria bacterium]
MLVNVEDHEKLGDLAKELEGIYGKPASSEATKPCGSCHRGLRRRWMWAVP